MNKNYHFPVSIEIDCEQPDALAKRIAEAIYDAVDTIVHEPDFNEKVTHFDMDYSIYVKADKNTFGKETTEELI